MYVQDVALPSGSDRNEKKTGRMQVYSSRKSMKSSQNESRLVWHEEETVQSKDINGEFKKLDKKLIF